MIAVERIIGSLIFSFFLSAAASVLIIRWFRRRHIGQSVRPDGPISHAAKAGTPTMGGIGIVLAVLTASLVWARTFSNELLLLFFSVLGFALVGYADDLLKLRRNSCDGLSVKQKLFWQAAVSVIMVLLIYHWGSIPMTQLYIPWFFQQPIDIGLVYYPLAVLYIMLFVNSVNLTDGLDGLAAGLGSLASMAALIIAVAGISVIPGIRVSLTQGIPGSAEIAVVTSGIIGALAGFLLFNRKPAKLFMGDTGSQAVGGILAVSAILLRSEVLFLFISGMFLLETLSVILQVGSYKLRQKRVFYMAPLHHHYELAGKSEISIVRVFWGIGALLSAAGVVVILYG